MLFAGETVRGEVGKNFHGWTEIDGATVGKEENGVEQFEDRVARLMDGEDDRP